MSFFLFFALTLSAYAQQISGTVSDENGVPLPGATVLIQGTSTGVSTDFDGNFSLYLGLSELSRLFEDHLYIMIFWIHFISINLFIGGWIVKDSQKFPINKVLMAVPLIMTYLIGPIGLFLYWIINANIC